MELEYYQALIIAFCWFIIGGNTIFIIRLYMQKHTEMKLRKQTKAALKEAQPIPIMYIREWYGLMDFKRMIFNYEFFHPEKLTGALTIEEMVRSKFENGIPFEYKELLYRRRTEPVGGKNAD